MDDTDCYPSGLKNVTIDPSYVSCDWQNNCTCKYCFSRNVTTGHCQISPPCNTYINGTCTAYPLSQFMAFMLSLFLTWTGAANFYIHKLELAIAQFSIGVLILFFTIIQFIHRQKIKKQAGSGCLFFMCFAITMLLCWVEIAWWLADVVIFGLNKRDDGSGCPLKSGL